MHDSDQDPTLRSDSTPNPGSAPAQPPNAIGPFRIVRKLGQGGMGVVYEAEQDQPRRSVALKVIRAGAFANERDVQLFEREADMLARLEHDSIAGIYQVGSTDGGQPYFAMELVRGRPLNQYLADQGPVSNRQDLRQRLSLFRQICDAVHYAHQRGVIHRDLKPSNILVVEPNPDESSQAKLTKIKILDFGLAHATDHEATRVTEIGMIKGTLQYMSPEQTLGLPQNVDTRADVYALGALLYETLTGRRPYDLTDHALAEAIRVICEKTPDPLAANWNGSYRPDVDIETIVGKALEKEPDRRYASVAALSEDLERYLTSQPILARPPSTVYQLKKMFVRNRAAFTAGAAVLVLVIASSIISTTLYFQAQRANARERIETEKAQGAANFMASIFDGVRPAVARGRDTTMLRDILDDAAARIDVELAQSPEVAALLETRIGRTYFHLDQIDEAEALLRSAVAKRDLTGPADDPDRLETLQVLAMVLAETDRHEEAEALFTEIIGARRRADPAGSAATAESLTELGRLLDRRSRHEEAEAALVEAIHMLRPTAAAEADLLGQAHNALGNLYHKLERLDEAEQNYTEALQLQRGALGEDHPSVLNTRHNLAYLARTRGDFAAAEAAFSEIIEVQRRILGDEHSDVANTLQSIASMRQAAGDFAGALEIFEDVLARHDKIYGRKSEPSANTLNSVALMHSMLGDPAEAERLQRETLAIRTELLGPDSVGVANTLENLARSLGAQDRQDDARDAIEEALRIYREVYGDEHDATLRALVELSVIQKRLGELTEAETTLRAVLDARRKMLGDTHSLVARSELELGRVLIDIGGDENVAEGEALMMQAQDNYARSSGEDYPAVAITRYRLGQALMMRGAYEEAEPWMLKAYDGLKKAYGEEHQNTKRAMEEILKLYEEWGKPEKAEEWRGRG